MGLIKELTTAKGIPLRYHRLEKCSINALGKVEMEVYSYVDYSFRQKEKDSIANNNRYNELMALIQTENEKDESERDTQAVVEWSEEINAMETQWVDMADESNQFVAEKKVYIYENADIEGNYNYHSAYDMLKTLDDFIGAENHID